MRNHIITLLQKKTDIPSLPEVLLRLEELINDQQSRISDIVRLIETDPVLSGKLLLLSNSVYYRGLYEITTIPMAIRRLGLNVIRDLAYCLILTRLFGNISFINTQQFWRHSLAVACFSRSLAKRERMFSDEKELAFLCGLMHDIGIIVFSYLIPDEYKNLQKEINKSDAALNEHESEKFGIDHAELGARFIENNWHLNDSIIQSVREHHFTFSGSIREETYPQIVNISNTVCNSQGFHNGFTENPISAAPESWQKILSQVIPTEDIMAEVTVALKEAETLLSFSRSV